MTDIVIEAKAVIEDGFIRSMNSLHRSALAVFVVIVAHSTDGELAEVSYQTIRKETGLSIWTITKCLSELKSAKVIEKMNKGIRKNAGIYKINFVIQ